MQLNEYCPQHILKKILTLEGDALHCYSLRWRGQVVRQRIANPRFASSNLAATFLICQAQHSALHVAVSAVLPLFVTKLLLQFIFCCLEMSEYWLHVLLAFIWHPTE